MDKPSINTQMTKSNFTDISFLPNWCKASNNDNACYPANLNEKY